MTQNESLRLGTLLGVLSEKLPLLEIKTRQGAAEDVREQVAAGLLLGGFYIGMQLPVEVGGLVLQTIHYRIVAPWRDRERVLHAGWRELAAMPWVGASPRHHVQVLLHGLFARQGLAPHQTIESDEVALPFSLARAGVGLALVREELALQGSERQEVVIWPHARVSAQLAFIYSHAAEHDPALVATLSALRGVWGLAGR